MLYKINNIHSTHRSEHPSIMWITNEISIECDLATINSGKKGWTNFLLLLFFSFPDLVNTAVKQRTITSIFMCLSLLCYMWKFSTAKECSIHLGSKKLFWPRYDSVRIWIKVGHKTLPPLRLKRWICVHKIRDRREKNEYIKLDCVYINLKPSIFHPFFLCYTSLDLWLGRTHSSTQ